MKIGITELILIFVVALFVLGPDKLPYYAQKLGEALSQFRKFSGEMAEDIKESVVEPLEEVQRPLREAVEPLTEIDKAVRGDVKEVQDAFAGIGKTKPKKPDTPKAEQTQPAPTEPDPAEREPSVSQPEETPPDATTEDAPSAPPVRSEDGTEENTSSGLSGERDPQSENVAVTG